ncbi:MAG TPA: histidine phosphatase family protein [Chthoniobacterales bacterium]|jgi:phosphohistidine phosphatase|nr:histidine phosphatase family protein [Chthoniobacterales bacterium]
MAKLDLIFLRHGLADWPDWPKPDDERPLTRKGREITHEVAAYLAKMEMKPRKILTSPLPRASQTAEIASEHLRAPVEVTKKLNKSFTLRKLEELLSGETGSVMVVGHEPNFSRVIKALTGGEIKLRKSGVARLTIDPEKMQGRLDWLLPPKICRA